MAMSIWKRRLITIVLLPTVAAFLVGGVGLLRGYLHRTVGFDGEGRPIADALVDSKVPVPKRTEARRPVATPELMVLVREDLERVDPERRGDCRYASFAHRHNDPTCDAEEIERERRALAELVRLLAPAGTTPRVAAIDPDRLVYRLRLSDLGWTEGRWAELARHYRYGLSFGGSSAPGLKEADAAVRGAVKDPLPVVRADWLVAVLTRPPLGGPNGSLAATTQSPSEVVRRVIESYDGRPIGLEAAAGELGVEPGRLSALIAGDVTLRESFGLAPLVEGRSVSREWWESDRNLTSPFQELARRLGLGKPLVRR